MVVSRSAKKSGNSNWVVLVYVFCVFANKKKRLDRLRVSLFFQGFKVKVFFFFLFQVMVCCFFSLLLVFGCYLYSPCVLYAHFPSAFNICFVYLSKKRNLCQVLI